MKLFAGPMSSEVVEAVFECSQIKGVELGLIGSMNQIGRDGYVMTDQEFMSTVGQLRMKYPKSNVEICRDHLGPWFESTYTDAIEFPVIDQFLHAVHVGQQDIAEGFNTIHLDFCKVTDYVQRLDLTKRALKILSEFASECGRTIDFEVGTDENASDDFSEGAFKRLQSEVDFFSKVRDELKINIKYYVVRTGSLVGQDFQEGYFEIPWVIRASTLLHSHGFMFKEHNADYLTRVAIQRRIGLVDAMNIAPQLGVLQTHYLIMNALKYGLDIELGAFLNRSYRSGKWRKWIDEYKGGIHVQAILGGHYVYQSIECKNLVEKISKFTNFSAKCREEHLSLLSFYIESMKGTV